MLVVIAFSVRLVYLNQIQSIPTVPNPIMDERYHVELAEKINSEEGPDREPFFRAPLYQYFLAFIYDATGNSIYWSRFIQIVFGSLLPLLILLLGRELFTGKVPYVAAWIAVFYPTFIYYDSSLLITSLMVLLTTLLAWRLY